MSGPPSAPAAIPFRTAVDVAAAIEETATFLRRGGLIAYPTETVYGLGGAADPQPIAALARLKGRQDEKPFLLLVSGLAMIHALGLVLTPAAEAFAARHWPGPVTLVLAEREPRLPTRLRGSGGGVAVRWTSHPGMARLLAAYDGPITSTSANAPAAAPACSAAEISEHWRAQVSAGELRVLDGGALPPSPPSTVLDCTGRRPRLLRAGAVPTARLRETVPELDDSPSA